MHNEVGLERSKQGCQMAMPLRMVASCSCKYMAHLDINNMEIIYPTYYGRLIDEPPIKCAKVLLASALKTALKVLPDY